LPSLSDGSRTGKKTISENVNRQKFRIGLAEEFHKNEN